MTVKELKTIFQWNFIIFSAPNTKCHKIVSYLRIRRAYKVRFRSMLKISYRHLKENITVV